MARRAKQAYDIGGDFVPDGCDVVGQETPAHDMGAFVVQSNLARDTQPFLGFVGRIVGGNGTVGAVGDLRASTYYLANLIKDVDPNRAIELYRQSASEGLNDARIALTSCAESRGRGN